MPLFKRRTRPQARHEHRHPSPLQTAQQQVPDPRPKTSSTFSNTDIIRKRVPEATCLNSSVQQI
ncbi:hypothetical protein J6590_055905 [Homalodisca vitripennis]|nr:hypothetical protein J6590_055905 [Homalodisca vitripennis]